MNCLSLIDNESGKGYGRRIEVRGLEGEEFRGGVEGGGKQR